MNTQQSYKEPNNITVRNYYETKPALVKNREVTGFGDFDNWDLDFLTDYIIDTHHSYVKKNAAVIYDLAREMSNQYGQKYPELTDLAEAIFFFFHDLLNHLDKEEQILFPNIKQLFRKRKHKETARYSTFGLIKDTIKLLQKEHLSANNDLILINKITENYLLPADACHSHKYLFEKMEEFENDLVIHVNLENTILFPKAISLDEKPQLEENVGSR